MHETCTCVMLWLYHSKFHVIFCFYICLKGENPGKGGVYVGQLVSQGRERVCLCGNREKTTVLYIYCCIVGGTEQCVRFGVFVCCFPVPYHGVWFHCGGSESGITVYDVCFSDLYVQIRCVGSM